MVGYFNHTFLIKIIQGRGDTMKYVFIANPAAGKKNRIMNFISHIQKGCSDLKLEYSIHISESGEGIRDYLSNLCEEETEPLRVYAIGGDGTLSHVVNGCINSNNVEIGVIPFGTGNDFVRNFTLDKDIFKKLEVQLVANSRKVDVIQFGNDYCINTLNVGLDANVAKDMPKYKRNPLFTNKMAYNASLFNNLCKKLGRAVEIYADDELVYEGDIAICCVANGTTCGGGFALAPQAKVDDGYLDISYILVPKKIQLPKIFAQVKKREQFEKKPASDYVRHVKCKKGRIVLKDSTTVVLDGEVQEHNEVIFNICKEKISFIVPREETLDK